MNKPATPTDCGNSCDFENAIVVGRATWLCPNCNRDFSIEYLYWAQAVHPEWFESDKQKEKQNDY